MKKINEIQKELDEFKLTVERTIDSLKNDLEELNNNENNGGIDFNLVKSKADNIIFKKHCLENEVSTITKKTYLKILINLILLDEDNQIERLSFVQWIINKIDIDLTLEKIYIESLKNDYESIESYKIVVGNLSFQLLVDLLILLNIGNEYNDDIIMYILDICSIFKVDEKEIIKYSEVVKILLTEEQKNFDYKKYSYLKEYIKNIKYYFDEINFDALHKRSVIFKRELNSIGENSINWKVNNNQKVEAGTIIATYSFVKWYGFSIKSYSNECIRSCGAGYINKFEYGEYLYVVLSNKLDDVSSIIQWLKEKNL